MMIHLNDMYDNTSEPPSDAERINCRRADFSCRHIHTGATRGSSSLVFLCDSRNLYQWFIWSASSSSGITRHGKGGVYGELFENMNNNLFLKKLWTIKFSYRRYMAYPPSSPCATLIYHSSWILPVFMSLTFCLFLFLLLCLYWIA